MFAIINVWLTPSIICVIVSEPELELELELELLPDAAIALLDDVPAAPDGKAIL